MLCTYETLHFHKQWTLRSWRAMMKSCNLPLWATSSLIFLQLHFPCLQNENNNFYFTGWMSSISDTFYVRYLAPSKPLTNTSRAASVSFLDSCLWALGWDWKGLSFGASEDLSASAEWVLVLPSSEKIPYCLQGLVFLKFNKVGMILATIICLYSGKKNEIMSGRSLEIQRWKVL